MSIKKNQPSYNKISLDSDQVGLWLQPGFVEGVRNERLSFDSLDAALRHIFQYNLESAVMLWNGIPVSLDYAEDIPAMICSLINILSSLQEKENIDEYELKIFSKNLSANWYIDSSGEFISICAEWHRVPGDYQEALNSFSTTTYSSMQFICEWKMVLQQCIQAINDAGAKLSGHEAKKMFKKLCKVESNIPARGRFYQYN